MKEEKEEVDGFLTIAERSDLLQAIREMSDVGFTIVDRDTKEVLAKRDSLPDRPAFFAKTKLWQVVQSVVGAVFMPQLIKRHLYFVDGKGTRYYLDAS